MRVNIPKIKTIFLAICAVFVVGFLGANQIIEMNEYMGMRSLSYSFGLFFSLFYLIFMLLIFLKCDQNSPHGILIGVLLFYSFIWFFAFYSVSGFIDTKLVFFGGLLFLVPILLLFISEKYLKLNYGFRGVRDGFFNLRVEIVITALIILVALLVYEKMGVSFSFIDSYKRRMLGREQLDGLLAYFFAMSLNGLAPLLAFLAIYNRRYLYLIIAFLFVFLGFGFIGTKAPIAYVVLMSLIGYYFVKGGNNIVYVLVLAMTGLVFLALLEYLLFDFSWIADIYIRRALLVAPQLQMYFLDFMFINPGNGFNFLIGSESTTPITFVIGDLYMGNPETNANTISFLTVLGQKGILGYSFNVLFLAVFFSLLAHLYKASRHRVWLAISTLYALLILEQSYSTAFVTSGIALSTILLILFSYQTKKNSYD